MTLTASQRVVYDVLARARQARDAYGEGRAELHNLAVAERAELSNGWTSEVLRSLEKMGLVRSRRAVSRSDPGTCWKMWTVA